MEWLLVIITIVVAYLLITPINYKKIFSRTSKKQDASSEL